MIVGDRILTMNSNGKFSYSDVIIIPHSHNYDYSIFIRFIYNNNEILVTFNHLLFSNNCNINETLILKKSQNININDCISTINGLQTILSKEIMTNYGLYSLITLNEYLVINDMVVSPFAYNHYYTNQYYNIYRLLYIWFPKLLKSNNFRYLNELFNDFITKQFYNFKYSDL